MLEMLLSFYMWRQKSNKMDLCYNCTINSFIFKFVHSAW